jgi:hypothetical protein
MSEGVEQAAAALLVPPGQPGSGRQRYGAAMTFHAAGLIGEGVLEAYRIASPLDHEAPARVLAARGEAVPGAAALAAVPAAAADYLAPLSGTAAARAALARMVPVAPVAGASALAARHLGTALAALRRRRAGLARVLAAAAPWLGWAPYIYPDGVAGASFDTGNAFASLASGPDCECGLFLIAPGVFYRDHAHAAPELYAPLTGPHGWRFAPGAALQSRRAHRPVWNPPHRPHAIKAGATPFLCLYVWTADLDAPPYMIAADDWDALA